MNTALVIFGVVYFVLTTVASVFIEAILEKVKEKQEFKDVIEKIASFFTVKRFIIVMLTITISAFLLGMFVSKTDDKETTTTTINNYYVVDKKDIEFLTKEK